MLQQTMPNGAYLTKAESKKLVHSMQKMEDWSITLLGDKPTVYEFIVNGFNKTRSECQKCAVCCKLSLARVLPTDVVIISRFLGILTQSFCNRFTAYECLEEDNDKCRVILRKSSWLEYNNVILPPHKMFDCSGCVFLQDDCCTIYPVRPLGCRVNYCFNTSIDISKELPDRYEEWMVAAKRSGVCEDHAFKDFKRGVAENDYYWDTMEALLGGVSLIVGKIMCEDKKGEEINGEGEKAKGGE